MNRKNILKEIGDRLKNDCIVSIEPDLPHLLMGPDILVGRSGRLDAIFIPKLPEIRSPDLLLVRLALCRLALPVQTVCNLIINHETCNCYFINRTHGNFHRIIDLKETHRIESIIKGNAGCEIKSIPNRIRQRVIKRSSILLDESIKQRNLCCRESSPTTNKKYNISGYENVISTSRWINNKTRKYDSNVFRKGPIYLFEEQKEKQPSFIEEINIFSSFSIQMDYDFNQGVPFPQDNNFSETAKLFILNRPPIYKHDPDKYFRCAAFAGIVITQRTCDVEEIGNIILSRIKEFNKK